MMKLIKANLGYVLTLCLLAAVFIYWDLNGYLGNIFLNRLNQTLGVMSLVYLYMVMFIGAVYAVWPNLGYKPIVFGLRKQLGISTFVVALTHGLVAVFGQLGGIQGLEFLTPRYLTALLLSTIALSLLGIMAISSLPVVKRLLGSWWKRVHKAIYVVAILVVFHVLIIGTHYRELMDPLSQVSIWALVILLVLESIRIDRYLKKVYPRVFKLDIALALCAILLTALILPVYTQDNVQPLSVHNQHDGGRIDENARYNITYSTNAPLEAQQSIEFEFKVYNALDGELVTDFTPINSQLMHINVVDGNLEQLKDYHPLFLNGSFFQDIQLPHDDKYYLLFKFYPTTGGEQEIQLTLDTRQEQIDDQKPYDPDPEQVAYFDKYQVRLMNTEKLSANKLRGSEQLITAQLYNRETGTPIEDLPFLGALSSITMVNVQTKQFVMGHATNLKPSQLYLNNNPKASPDTVEHSHIGILDLRPYELGGPEVQFEILDPLQKLTPGVYRVFMSFTPSDRPFQVTFTLEII